MQGAEYAEERFAIGSGNLGEEAVLAGADVFADGTSYATALGGDREQPDAAIVRIRGALDQAGVLELVKGADDPRLVGADRLGQRGLRAHRSLVQHGEHRISPHRDLVRGEHRQLGRDECPHQRAQHRGEAPAASDEVVEEEEVEEQHSNVPMPAGVQRVTVRAIGRRVRLIGEPAINGVAVDGPHVIKRDGDTLAISSEGDMGVSIDGFSMLRNPTDLKSHVNGLAKELSIRVNPSLQVEIEVTGGSVNAERLPGLSRVRVTAGTAKVADVDGPIDLLVQAGSATLDAQITKGRSRVRVESGTANVSLRRGSDVRVHTEAQLGRVTWTGAVSGQSKDVEIGRGRAALDVEVLVGTAQIVSD